MRCIVPLCVVCVCMQVGCDGLLILIRTMGPALSILQTHRFEVVTYGFRIVNYRANTLNYGVYILWVL